MPALGQKLGEAREAYALNPKSCMQCGTKLTYERKRCGFCNRSCALTYRHATARMETPEKVCQNCGRAEGDPRKRRKYCGRCSRECERRDLDAECVASGDATLHNHNLAGIKAFVERTQGKCCSICHNSAWMGRTIPLVLDHIDGDFFNNQVANLRVVCGNCNMQLPTYKPMKEAKHQRRAVKYREVRAKYIARLGGVCVDCGCTTSLEFDHVNPEEKTFNVSMAFAGGNQEQLEAELAKIVLRCRACHREKTTRYMGKRAWNKEHGTRSGYEHGGCRCEACKAANAARHRAYMDRVRHARVSTLRQHWHKGHRFARVEEVEAAANVYDALHAACVDSGVLLLWVQNNAKPIMQAVLNGIAPQDNAEARYFAKPSPDETP